MIIDRTTINSNTMTSRDECLANAVECQRMARITRDNGDRRTWLDMAVSWMRKANDRGPIGRRFHGETEQ